MWGQIGDKGGLSLCDVAWESQTLSAVLRRKKTPMSDLPYT